MSTIAEVELPADEFVLGPTLTAVPDVAFEVVRVAAHSREQIVPYLRVTYGSSDEVDIDLDALLAEDATVEDVELLDELADERLYRMSWVYDTRFISHVLLDEGATILEMVGQDDRWYLRILFPTRESLRHIHDFCGEQGLTFEVKRIHELSGSVGRGEFGLSEEQYEALVTAVERGYFDVPRSVTMADLADELGIAQQSLSERFRRAHKTLINSALRAKPASLAERDRPDPSSETE